MCPTLFIDALNGKYQNETRWISREDFFRLKDTDPYVAVVWSFGNNLRDYLYSKEIEPLKKAIHYAIFFRDYSLGKELGYDLSFIEPISNIQRRYAAVKRYFSQFGHFQQQSFEGSESSHQLQVEHFTRGGQNHRDCRAQRLTNDSIPTFSLTGGKSHQPDWKQSNDLQTSVRTSTSRMPQPSLRDSKKKSTGRTLKRRTSQLHCTDCNTGSDNYPFREIRGGHFQTSHQVFLIIPRSKSQKIA